MIRARHAVRDAAIAAAMGLTVQGSGAACLDEVTVARLVSGYPIAPVSGLPTDLSLDDAYCSQARYVALLRTKMGEPVGYKVAFTDAALQRRLGLSLPATGVLFEPMFIANGGSIARGFAHRPVIEPDLLVVVRDAGIMSARSELDAARHLASVHPLIELSAIQLAQGEPVTGAGLVAINVSAVHMVMGPGTPVQATPEFVRALAEMETTFTDETGTLVQRALGSALLGNPMRVVLWLVEDFRRRGKTLAAGDRLSLGAVGTLFPLTQDDKTYTYTLSGLPGGPIAASVHIR